MAKGPFSADQLVPTAWSTAEEKAKFGNTFLRFVESNFDRKLFTKSFYQRLSNCFSHIAHYNIFGFYNTWFERDFDRLEFLKHTLRYPCYGDPKFTYSDVERAVQGELERRNLVPVYEQRIAAVRRTHELRELERLKQKYEPGNTPGPDEEAAHDPGDTNRAAGSHTVVLPPGRVPIQGNLFE